MRYPECHSRMLSLYGFTDGHANRDCMILYVDPKDYMKMSDPEDQPEDVRLNIKMKILQ